MALNDWPALLTAWQELDVPDGWRAEIGESCINLTPPPGNSHNRVVDLVHRALARITSDDCGLYQKLGVSIPSRAKLFVPSLVIVPRAELDSLPDNEPVRADHALLVSEIANAETDRKSKRWSYAHAGVPLYLLIDRFDEDGPAVTLFSDPVDGHYQHLVRIPFGEKISLPEPFGIDLDTGGF